MENNEGSESSDNSKEIIEEEEDEYDSDRPNLIHLNTRMERIRRENELELLERKRQRNESNTDIVYDANKKKIVNSFIPNLEELNEFLKNCTIKEIDINDIQKEIEKLPKEKIFDPESFIEANYGKNEKNKKNDKKNSFSIEELGLDLNNDINNIISKEEEPKEKNEEKNILNEILLEKDLNKQKKDIHDLIEKIKKLDIENIIKSRENNANTKLNIVLDLDNTCIFGKAYNYEYLIHLKKKYPNKNIRIIEFIYEGHRMFSLLIIRKGLSEFFDYAKKFCDFYINTAAYENYGKEIKNILEKDFGIKFCGFKGRGIGEDVFRGKFLYSLNLESKNTIIFDDQAKIWIKDNESVIISKYFTDRNINFDSLKYSKQENKIESFLSDYPNFYYYKSSEENWLKQKLDYSASCPFFNFDKLNCYSGEYLESTSYQFIYMKEIIKTIYYLVYNSKMHVSEALKIIRYNIFYNSCFDLSFYEKECVNSVFKKKESVNILSEIIKNCGGIIYNEKSKNQIKGMKFFFVCTSENYNKYKEDIKKAKIGKENTKVVSDKYILNSFYFMTNLEDELGNPQYCFDFNDEDDFDY